MGPLRFERRSEDPQSPRMARLPYGPALMVLARITYVISLYASGEGGVGRHRHRTGNAETKSGNCTKKGLAQVNWSNPFVLQRGESPFTFPG